METTILLPVSFTADAVQEIKRLAASNPSTSDRMLRVGVKGGGCSGLSYILEFDEKNDKDEVYDGDGFIFIMNRSHGIYLHNMEIDWSGGLNARGFTFNNPNASKTCGCGTSFAV